MVNGRFIYSTYNEIPLSFAKADLTHKEHIFTWLEKSHVKEFWDNSQEHRTDIIIFMEGKKQASPYYNGIIYTYWIGSFNDEPFCLIMTSEILPNEEDLPQAYRDNLATQGKTYSIDFMIGNENYLNKKLAAPTLQAFTHYIKNEAYPEVSRFFIDPVIANTPGLNMYISKPVSKR